MLGGWLESTLNTQQAAIRQAAQSRGRKPCKEKGQEGRHRAGVGGVAGWHIEKGQAAA
jgi:hypothetical protein